MIALLLPLADAAEEGRNIILSMLVVGLVFVTIVLGGDLLKAWRHRRRRY